MVGGRRESVRDLASPEQSGSRSKSTVLEEAGELGRGYHVHWSLKSWTQVAREATASSSMQVPYTS